MEPGFADHIALLHRSDIGGSAVFAVIRVVPDAEILLVPKDDLVFRYTRIQDPFRHPFAFLPVDIQSSVRDPYLVSRN